MRQGSSLCRMTDAQLYARLAALVVFVVTLLG